MAKQRKRYELAFDLTDERDQAFVAFIEANRGRDGVMGLIRDALEALMYGAPSDESRSAVAAAPVVHVTVDNGEVAAALESFGDRIADALATLAANPTLRPSKSKGVTKKDGRDTSPDTTRATTRVPELDDSVDTLEITEVTGGDSGQNFLNSMLNLQQ